MYSTTASDPADLPADVRERAARVRLAVFDVDGVLTDGRLAYVAEGAEARTFHVRDGLGLKLLRRAGIVVAWISARTSPVVARRAHELGIDHLHQDETDKLARLCAIAGAHDLGLDQIAYMGDDLPDLPCLARVGLAIAPANAHPWVRDRVHWRTRLAGGEGAVREACDLILSARGEDRRIIADAIGEPLR
jgi:3-deoxy-D-manno-octulosonate 8-phosphate phosphatase (KDO 8-P phosphatase)